MASAHGRRRRVGAVYAVDGGRMASSLRSNEREISCGRPASGTATINRTSSKSGSRFASAPGSALAQVYPHECGALSFTISRLSHRQAAA